MLGNGRLGKIEAGDDIADGALVRGEQGEDVTAARFGHGVEGVGGGRSTSHVCIIFPYGNMSSGIFVSSWTLIFRSLAGRYKWLCLVAAESSTGFPCGVWR